MADLDIVIVTYNCVEWVDRFLGGLPAALDGLSADVVVVDNPSIDGSADRVARHCGITFVRNEDNVGFAKGSQPGCSTIEFGLGPAVEIPTWSCVRVRFAHSMTTRKFIPVTGFTAAERCGPTVRWSRRPAGTS
jgi:GT2 family glycosyltransferase